MWILRSSLSFLGTGLSKRWRHLQPAVTGEAGKNYWATESFTRRKPEQTLQREKRNGKRWKAAQVSVGLCVLVSSSRRRPEIVPVCEMLFFLRRQEGIPTSSSAKKYWIKVQSERDLYTNQSWVLVPPPLKLLPLPDMQKVQESSCFYLGNRGLSTLGFWIISEISFAWLASWPPLWSTGSTDVKNILIIGTEGKKKWNSVSKNEIKYKLYLVNIWNFVLMDYLWTWFFETEKDDSIAFFK